MNVALTQTKFDRIRYRFLYLLSKYMVVREVRHRFERSTVRILDFGNTTLKSSNFALVGVIIGTNTDAKGRLYKKVIKSSGNVTVELYKATGGGGGDKVATSAATAFPVTSLALAASNSSGITGTCDVGTLSASDANDDTNYLTCFVDAPLRDVQVFNGDEVVDPQMRTSQGQLNTDIVSGLLSVEQRLGQEMDTLMGQYVSTIIPTTSTVWISKGRSVDNGAVSLRTTGIIEDLRAAMNDNDTGSPLPQYVVRKVVSAAAAVFDAGNTGKGAITSPTFYESIVPGTLLFEIATDTVGSEEFNVTYTRADNLQKIQGQGKLRIGKEYKDSVIGISSLTIARTFTKTNDSSNLNLAAIGASFSVSGETPSNTSSGVLFWKIVANASNWNLYFYRAAGLQDGDLVAQAINVATGAVFQATATSAGGGLVVNGTVGSAPVTTTTGQFNLNCFRAGPPKDRASIIITQTSSGAIQQLLGELVDIGKSWYLNSVASGSETWLDNDLLRSGAALSRQTG